MDGLYDDDTLTPKANTLVEGGTGGSMSGGMSGGTSGVGGDFFDSSSNIKDLWGLANATLKTTTHEDLCHAPLPSGGGGGLGIGRGGGGGGELFEESDDGEFGEEAKISVVDSRDSPLRLQSALWGTLSRLCDMPLDEIPGTDRNSGQAEAGGVSRAGGGGEDKTGGESKDDGGGGNDGGGGDGDGGGDEGKRGSSSAGMGDVWGGRYGSKAKTLGALQGKEPALIELIHRLTGPYLWRLDDGLLGSAFAVLDAISSVPTCFGEKLATAAMDVLLRRVAECTLQPLSDVHWAILMRVCGLVRKDSSETLLSDKLRLLLRAAQQTVLRASEYFECTFAGT
jgi:hypothetical protein